MKEKRTTQLLVKLTATEAKQLQELATKKGIGKSTLLRQLLRKYIEEN